MPIIQTEKLGRKPLGQGNGAPKKETVVTTNLPRESLYSRPLPAGVIPDDDQPNLAAKPLPTVGGQPRTVTDNHRTVSTPLTGSAGEGWARQEFPSGCKPYTFDEIQVRILDVGVLKALTASMSASSFTQMIDALQTCINVDIRDLTVPDLYFFMYWLRINSYPKSPLTVTWNSKYGNKNVTRVTMSTFRIIELDMTKQELDDFRHDGIVFPTVRDMEVLMNKELSPDDKWEIEYAQYMHVDVEDMSEWMAAKVEAFHAMGPDAISQVNAFSKKIAHGVIEEVTCIDAHFEIETGITNIETEIADMSRLINALIAQDDPSAASTAMNLTHHVAEREKVLAALKDARDNGTDYIPDSEVVTLSPADVTLLFP